MPLDMVVVDVADELAPLEELPPVDETASCAREICAQFNADIVAKKKRASLRLIL